MRRILFLSLLLCWQLNALDVASTLKIYHGLFSSLLNRAHYTIYTDDQELRDVFAKSSKISITSTPVSADIIVVSKRSTLPKITSTVQHTITIATKYTLLRKSKHIACAFYWRKGRAQLLFIKSRLRKLGISLPSKYRKYTVEKL